VLDYCEPNRKSIDMIVQASEVNALIPQSSRDKRKKKQPKPIKLERGNTLQSDKFSVKVSSTKSKSQTKDKDNK
jgi:hypothetical protein